MSRRFRRKIAFFFICLFGVSLYLLRLGGTIPEYDGGTQLEPYTMRYNMILATVGTKVYIDINASEEIEVYFMNYTQGLNFFSKQNVTDYLYYNRGRRINTIIQIPYSGAFYLVINNTTPHLIVTSGHIIIEFWNHIFILPAVVFLLFTFIAFNPYPMSKILKRGRSIDEQKNTKDKESTHSKESNTRIFKLLLKKQSYAMIKYYNILAFSILVLTIAGGFTLIGVSNQSPVNLDEYIRLELKRKFYEFFRYTLPLYAIGFSTLLSTSLFSSEYEKGYLAVQLALPIKRKDLFFAKLLSALIFLLAPYIIVPVAVIITSTYIEIPKAMELALMLIPFSLLYNAFILGLCILANIVIKKDLPSALVSFIMLTLFNVLIFIFPSYEIFDWINPFESLYIILIVILEYTDRGIMPVDFSRYYFSVLYIGFLLILTYFLSYQIFKRQDIP